MLCNLLWISSHSPKKLLKLVWNCCDEFEQVNGGCLISYVSTAWVNQFEIKHTCIEFNNGSTKGNNVKLK